MLNFSLEMKLIKFYSTPLPELTAVFAEPIKQVPFSMATENVDLIHECSPEHLSMVTARLE